MLLVVGYFLLEQERLFPAPFLLKRVQALKEVFGKDFEVEVTIHNYSDENVLRGMVIENLTQRRGNFKEELSNLKAIRKWLRSNVQPMNETKVSSRGRINEGHPDEQGSVRDIYSWLNKNGEVMSIGKISEILQIADKLSEELINEIGKKRNQFDNDGLTFSQGVSGVKISRPQLDLMLQDMRNKFFEGIVVWKYDRLGRSTIHLLQVLEEIKNLNLRLIATSQNIDTSTPMGKYFVTNLVALADLEREMIIERTQAKLDYYKQQIKERGFYITEKGEKKTSLGRNKGSKDKGRRKKSGYYQRWINKSPHKKQHKIPSIIPLKIENKQSGDYLL